MTRELATFKALANPHRLAILDQLSVNRMRWYTVLELAVMIGLSHSQTSQHLKILRKTGFITSREDGNTVLNRMGPRTIWPVKVFE